MRLYCIMSLSGCTYCLLSGRFQCPFKNRNSKNVMHLSICSHNFCSIQYILGGKFFKPEITDQYFLLKHAMNWFQPILWSEKKERNWRYLNVFCLYRGLSGSYNLLDSIVCVTCLSLVSEQCLPFQNLCAFKNTVLQLFY